MWGGIMKYQIKVIEVYKIIQGVEKLDKENFLSLSHKARA